MSSFLDSTGLDRLATKLKAYFMKKPTTASSSSYPLVGYDATNNVGKYNSDIKLDLASRAIYGAYTCIGSIDASTNSTTSYKSLGTLQAKNSSNYLSMLVSSPNRISNNNTVSTYLVEVCNRQGARSIRYTLLSPDHGNESADYFAEFGFIADSSNNMTIVAKLPPYPGLFSVVRLNESRYYNSSTFGETVSDTSGYTSGTRYEIAHRTGYFPNMTAGYATRSRTMYDDSSSALNQGVHTYGTPNTDAKMSGWKKICTIKKGDTYSYSSAIVAGILFAADSNWGEKISYKTHFRVKVNFTGMQYRVSLDNFPLQSRFIRLVEVTARDTYEVQVQPQWSGASYASFWLYGFTERTNNSSIEWSSGNLTEAGSNGTVLDNYEYDFRYSGSCGYFVAVHGNYALPYITGVQNVESGLAWLRIKNASSSSVTITAKGDSLSQTLAAGAMADFYFYDYVWHTS